ncbi:sensor domain-containing diguanylate cyclase [Thalassotalea piscium]|uniref:PAS domain S-box-containing protein n=1 Tax=Thalassotalea piscium TaxID=1230533 RepID=A0A7X0TUH5_9GAMM|nr:PAS domain S-box protein [Thalassotalea piscium]MBB6544213.1 PAS domain S-box-containing protein [Thalassotalea piscium]
MKDQQTLIESILLTNDGVGIFDPEDRLIFCNDALAIIFGVTATEALHKTFSQLCFSCFNSKLGINIESEDFNAWMEMALSKRRKSNYRTFETDTAQGAHFIVTEQIVQNNYLYTYVTDITEKKKYEHKLTVMSQELEQLATTDYLTGIRNRRYFYEKGRAEFNRSKREETKLSVLLLGL